MKDQGKYDIPLGPPSPFGQMVSNCTIWNQKCVTDTKPCICKIAFARGDCETSKASIVVH